MTTPTLSLGITLTSHMTQKGHQTKYYRRKYIGNKEAFPHGKFEMLKEYVSAQYTMCCLCNTIYCLQLSL